MMVDKQSPDHRARGRGKYDRSRSQRERRQAQRDALLDAATTVFATRGFALATVELIVGAAGMSRRTFYEHFVDIRDILLRVHERAAQLAFGLVRDLAASEPDPLQRIRGGITAYLSMIASYPEIASVVLREVRSAGPDYEPRRELETTRYASLLFEALAIAHAQGKLSRPPDELTVYALATSVEAVAMRYIGRGEAARAPEAADKLADLVIRAFL
jgi:AcrR family transcriptional regulator